VCGRSQWRARPKPPVVVRVRHGGAGPVAHATAASPASLPCSDAALVDVEHAAESTSTTRAALG
jgi:hypothetical protein